jgi:catechol 2,3-dioxygenase-like lactoylglutathione lyase family enzyme
MRAMPIRYARDVERSVRFYQALGLDLQAVARPGAWVADPDGTRVQVNEHDRELYT